MPDRLPAPDESLRHRLARAMFPVIGGVVWENATIGGQYQREQSYRLADTAISVMRGESP